MSARTVGLALAAGLFVLAGWLAWRPGASPSVAGRQDIPAEERKPAVGAVPTVFPGSLPKNDPKKSFLAANPAVLPGPSASLPFPPAATPAFAEEGTDLNSPGAASGTRVQTAQTDVVKVRVMMKDFHTLMGENPVGTNAEIMQALMGVNPRQAKLGPPEGMLLNGSGELVDPWQTPYFFHQLSKDTMEIRSAGPDKVLWTNDDVIVR